MLALVPRLMACQDRRNTGFDLLTTFFDLSWFHRTWTVQEAALSMQEKSIMICDRREILWSRLKTATRRLKAEGLSEGRVEAATQLQDDLSGMILLHRLALLSNAIEEEFRRHGRTTVPHATDLFRLAQEKEATDPKDKVFALYGLLQELDLDGPFQAPDYDKSLPQVYAETARACIMQDSNLWILLFASQIKRRGDVPSWVPDWSTPMGSVLQNSLASVVSTICDYI
jgi:hypothetical protein